MTDAKPTARQVVGGFLLGLLISPLGLLIGSWLLMSDSDRRSELSSLGVVMLSVMYFGSLQAVAVVPAAWLASRSSRPGIAHGLLWFGVAAALLNGILWIANYRDYGHPTIQ